MTKFFVETFGCTANTAASELMTYLLLECGYKKAQSINEADFVLINTCIVKAPTESKIKSYLLKLYKKVPLIISGCLPQVFSDWCHENTPKAVLLGVDHFGAVCQAAKALLEALPFELLSRQRAFCETVRRDYVRKLTRIIEISKGCTGNCAYCIVRIAKGPLVSKSPKLILKEAKEGLKDRCKEFWLTAQDTASYGIDFGSSLPEIVSQISNLNGNFMIRVGMMSPDYALKIFDELKMMYQNPKVYSFAHIPVQSGSDQILERMKRKYAIHEYEFLISELRKVATTTLSTDIICGFPGETEEDHELTKELLLRVKPDIVNVSKYTDRKGTQASQFEEKLPTEIIKSRSREVAKIVEKIALESNKQWVGWQGLALALSTEERTNSTLMRNRSYKLISVEDLHLPLGKKYKVLIEKASKTRLIASLV